jgi:hypothetical protein
MDLETLVADLVKAVKDFIDRTNELTVFRADTLNVQANYMHFNQVQGLISQGYTEAEAEAQLAEWTKDPTDPTMQKIKPVGVSK